MSSSVSFADHTTSRIVLKAAVPSAVLLKCLGTYLETNRLRLPHRDQAILTSHVLISAYIFFSPVILYLTVCSAPFPTPTPCPPPPHVEVTERELLEDLIYVFQGIDGHHLHYSSRDSAYRLRPKVRQWHK